MNGITLSYILLIIASTALANDSEVQENAVLRRQKRRSPMYSPGQTPPKTIAFHVFLTSTMSSIGSNQIIRFNRVTTNEGNAYDTSNGIFTCIKAGLYYFHWNVMAYSGQTTFVCLSVDGVCTGGISYGTSPNNYDSAANSVVIRLTLGQQVWIENKTSGGYIYTYYSSSYSQSAGTTFSGYFMSE